MKNMANVAWADDEFVHLEQFLCLHSCLCLHFCLCSPVRTCFRYGQSLLVEMYFYGNEFQSTLYSVCLTYLRNGP